MVEISALMFCVLRWLSLRPGACCQLLNQQRTAKKRRRGGISRTESSGNRWRSKWCVNDPASRRTDGRIRWRRGGYTENSPMLHPPHQAPRLKTQKCRGPRPASFAVARTVDVAPEDAARVLLPQGPLRGDARELRALPRPDHVAADEICKSHAGPPGGLRVDFRGREAARPGQLRGAQAATFRWAPIRGEGCGLQ